MKYLGIIAAALAAGLSFASDADVRTVSKTDRVSGGSLTETNSVVNNNMHVRSSAAYCLKHVMFTIPVTNVNVFAVRHIRTMQRPPASVTLVTTSAVYNITTKARDVETNTYFYAQTPITFTNTVTIATTTNNTSTQVYDTDDFPKDWMFESDDIVTYTFSVTNAFPMIRVFDVHQRP
jgi:hypothetical protein